MALFAEIAVDSFAVSSESNGVFDYLIPEEFNDILKRGTRVIVPFSGRLVEGYVTGIKTNSKIDANKLKQIHDVPDIEPVFSDTQFLLSEWMSDEYMCSISECLKCIITHDTVMKENKYAESTGKKVMAEHQLKDRDIKILDDIMSKGGTVLLNELYKIYGKSIKSSIAKLLKSGLITLKSTMTARVKEKTLKAVEIYISPAKIQETLCNLRKNKNHIKQANVLEIIASQNRVMTQIELIKDYGISKSTIDSLLRSGILKNTELRISRDPYKDVEFGIKRKPELTEEQKKVMDKILAGFYGYGQNKFLIHGVTGSGKTEVYMRLIEHMIEKGRQSVVLVPEISLTPQTVEWFKGRFKRVAVLHSRLSKGERYDEWTKIKNGEIDVVVGARSAVFAPFDRLGLIIIDEEHETSYKSDTTPKYNAKDVAAKRCEIENALLILGSATPAVETYYDTKNGRYVLCTMNSRISGRSLPDICISDMRLEMEEGNRTIFSRKLYNEIRNTLNTRQQTILFLNRRGYSTFVSCRKCGQAVKCPKCDVSLSYHSDTNVLNCHYCGYITKPPGACPSCGSKYIKYFGIGTQKVENEVKRFFPSARVLRMDLDTTSQKGSHDRIYRAFKNHEADILIGTQMISKGLDFPEVTLVGIIAADLTLNIPDFRSAERSFQLMTQVAGRAGRGDSPGKVIIQTYNPEHYSITSSINHDYELFYNREIEIRKSFGYPPFSDIINIISSSKDEGEAAKIINDVTDRLRKVLDGLEGTIDILGPTPAPISKINTYYRWQTIIKGQVDKNTKRIIKSTVDDRRLKTGNAKLNMDINPVSLA